MKDKHLNAIAAVVFAAVIASFSFLQRPNRKLHEQCKNEGKVFVREHFGSKRGCIDESLLK